MLSLALLWHQHQPLYKRLDHATERGSYCQPWVRLHVVRDYYAMAALLRAHPDVHLTINLTPVLLRQLEDYATCGATDTAQELSLTPAEALRPHEREAVLSTFFDADWHHQIFPHPRYAELFQQRQRGQPFSDRDMRDLQLGFNLAWFGDEFRAADQRLVTGEVVAVRRFVEQGRDFAHAEVIQLLAEQEKILRAVIPLHRALQDAGQIEVSTTPYYHPILPLVIDTDRVTRERPGDRRPSRFSHPEDADAQVAQAIEAYTRWFGRPPQGMWPAEGAVSQQVVSLFARHGVRWIASDQGVLTLVPLATCSSGPPEPCGAPWRVVGEVRWKPREMVAGCHEGALGHLRNEDTGGPRWSEIRSVACTLMSSMP